MQLIAIWVTFLDLSDDIWLPKIASSDATGHENDNIRPGQHKVSDSCCFTHHVPPTPLGRVRRTNPLWEDLSAVIWTWADVLHGPPWPLNHRVNQMSCRYWLLHGIVTRGGTSTLFCRNAALSVNYLGTHEGGNPNPCIYDPWVSGSGDKLKWAIISGVILSPWALTAFLSAAMPREALGLPHQSLLKGCQAWWGKSKPEPRMLLPVWEPSDWTAYPLGPNGATGKQSSKILADKSGWKQARTRAKQKLQIKYRSSLFKKKKDSCVARVVHAVMGTEKAWEFGPWFMSPFMTLEHSGEGRTINPAQQK